MHEAKKYAWKTLEWILESIAVKIHIEACSECRQKYFAITKHIEELEKNAEKVSVQS